VSWRLSRLRHRSVAVRFAVAWLSSHASNTGLWHRPTRADPFRRICQHLTSSQPTNSRVY